MSLPILPGATSQSVYIKAIDNTTGLGATTVTSATAGLSISYQNGQTGTVTAISLSDLAATNSAWSSGGMKHIAGGVYRLCIPDAAVPATEGERTIISGTATAFQILGVELVGKPVEVVSGSLVAATVTGSVGSVATGGIASASFASGATIPRVTLADTLTTYTGNTVQTGDSYTRLGAPAGASVSADIAANASSLATLLSRITGAVSLAAATTAAAIRSALGLASANLDTQLDALPTAAENADAVWDEALSGHAVAGSAGAALSTAGSAADPLSNTVPGSYASGSAGHALGRIGSGQITTVSRVSQAGNIEELIGGATYSSAAGTSFDWTDADDVWPTLTAASVTVSLAHPDGQTASYSGSVVTATGTGKKVRLELTAVQSAALQSLTVGRWSLMVWATLSGGAVVPLVSGYANVVDKPGP